MAYWNGEPIAALGILKIHVDVVGTTRGFLLAGGPTSARPLVEMTDLASVSWGSMATDHYYTVVHKAANRVIDFPLFVGPKEECEDAWLNRKSEWAVPGVQYPARKRARHRLKGCDLLASWLPLSQIAHRVSRLVGSLPDLAIKWLQRRQLNHLAENRYAFTCGSPLGQPIRKFFEISAAGALLVAEPFHGAHHLGFIDRVHYYNAVPESLCDLHHEMESSLEVASQIVAKGRDLILDKHSVAARAIQLNAVQALIVEGKFGGSCWRNGQYEIYDGAARNTHQSEVGFM